MQQLNGRVAFITGGASGIGLGIARALGRAGMRIVLGDIEAAALSASVDKLRKEGIETASHLLDVTDRQAVERAATEVVDIFGAVHLLCNNAGVNAPGPADELSFSDWDWVLGVNLHGVVNGVVSFLPELKRHPGQAHIVNTASTGGLVGMRNLAPYNTSKFGVVGLSEALRADLQAFSIGVSVLCPGVVRTNLADSERNRPERLKNEIEPDAATGDAPAESPLRLIEPEEVGVQVREAIVNDAFFVCTHPEFLDVVRQRNAALEASLSGNEHPRHAKAALDLVRPFA